MFGALREGLIDAKPGEKVIFIGDCATYKGKIGESAGQHVESLYRERSAPGPLHREAR